MMTNLMTISVKKASISSKLTTVYLSCPPLCGLFSIQQNAKGGLSYKVKKNPACRILRLRRVALATFFHSAAVRSLAERFLCHRAKFPMTHKNTRIGVTYLQPPSGCSMIYIRCHVFWILRITSLLLSQELPSLQRQPLLSPQAQELLCFQAQQPQQLLFLDL